MAEASHYGAQTKARKAALDVLFSAELRQLGFAETLSEQRSLSDKQVRPLTTELVLGVAEHQHEIDDAITAALSEKWTLERMPAVDRNLARIAVYELGFTQTPKSAVIAEALRLARDLSTDESPAFLNGVLSRATISAD